MLDLDAVLFEQVLVNLLDNAAKYAPPGSTVTLTGGADGGAVVLTVARRGAGPRAGGRRARVREVLPGQVRATGNAPAPGLGLAICRGFVEALGGTIEAANRTDRSGAAFTVTFPEATFAAARARRRPPNERAQHPAPRGGRRAADPPPAAHQPRRPGLPGPGGRDGPGRPGPLGARDARGGAARPGPARSGRPGGDPPRARVGARTWPVIVLSSRGDERGKVEALDLGADDYVTKPFGMARARRAHPHGAAPPGPGARGRGRVPERGPHVDLTRRLVKVRGAEVRLSNKEWDILRLLVVNAGKVLTHRMIMQEVWGPKVDVQYLRIYVRQLRQKLEQDPERPQHILTETGVGYRLRARAVRRAHPASIETQTSGFPEAARDPSQLDARNWRM